MPAPPSPRPPVRYVFGRFVISTRRRELRADGVVQPLIPRYFDLLVFLVAHRADAVHRQAIFDGVWTDVIVSDSALSQAIRTLRRVLDDDSREPRFIRTVSRHGYQFVCADVREEADDGLEASRGAAPPVAPSVGDSIAAQLERLRRPGASEGEREEQRDLAERLHAHGADLLAALAAMPAPAGHARALLRDARWDVAAPVEVPLAGLDDAWQLVRLRLSRAGRLVAARWASAAVGAGLAGLVAGLGGGVLLALAPGSAAPLTVAPVLATLGALAGATAGAGVGAGLAVGEAVWRSHRGVALAVGGAVGGGAVGLTVQWLARWTLAALVGLARPIGGGLEGLVLGTAAGVAFAAVTAGGGFAAPRGAARTRVVVLVALACGVAALALAASGRPLVGGTVHLVASASAGGQAVLSPLGRLVGEPGFGSLTATLISAAEGAFFGTGLTLGLTRRR
ncbi:MAG: winged helix-turn-helix domain-containing protein [Vicinamibacterales bacterium]